MPQVAGIVKPEVARHIWPMTTTFRLAELLERRDMTQAELARLSGIGLRTISRLARNETGQVSLETLDRLAAVLDVQPGELIAREAAKRKRP